MSLVSPDEQNRFPLSPMQAGMLYESLLYGNDGEAGFERGFNVEQLCVKVRGGLNTDNLSQAFTLVTRRHAILSAAFAWDGLDRPQLVTLPDAQVPALVVKTVAESDFEKFLEQDRSRGFDL